ncbi:MAG: DUF3592 domain-containing protein [Lachnospiraceae bacterium]|nr:DUF3592 domain-containing protein [Lachnospiraceae bacterium]
MENMIGFLICILIGLVMLISGVIVLLVFKKKRKKYCDTVIGVSTTFASAKEAVPDDGIRRTYNCGVFEYEYQGNIYHINSLVSTTGNVKIGKKKKIYVNPNQPDDCMIDAWVYVFTASILIAIALLFMVIGFAVL